MPISKNNVEIKTLEAWEKRAGPKAANQWVDGRSAKEVARAWLDAGPNKLPGEVAQVFASSKDFGPILSWRAEPEVKLPFDKFPGEPRNSDLVVWACDQRGPYVFAVEAKADEVFAETLDEILVAALERKLANPRSNGFTRVEQLARALFPPRTVGLPAIGPLRYQLLTACAGVLCEAERKGYDRAVMLVHEFVTNKTSDDKHARNAADLDNFVCRISCRRDITVQSNRLRGPFYAPGQPLLTAKIALYIGKAQRNLRK
jgi:hypothetical protein